MFAKIFLPIVFGAAYSSCIWAMVLIPMPEVIFNLLGIAVGLGSAALIIWLTLAAVMDYS